MIINIPEEPRVLGSPPAPAVRMPSKSAARLFYAKGALGAHARLKHHPLVRALVGLERVDLVLEFLRDIRHLRRSMW